MFEGSCTIAVGQSSLEIVGRHPELPEEEATGAMSMADDNKSKRRRGSSEQRAAR